MLKRIAIALALVAAAVWLWNTSWLAPKPDGAPRLIAHRGVHQTYNREGLTNETCTAERIDPPRHDFIENTLGGKTFPLRGRGVGMMPALQEVLAAMPERRFLINFKSNETREGDMLAALLAAHPEWRQAVWGAYGGDGPTLRAGR